MLGLMVKVVAAFGFDVYRISERVFASSRGAPACVLQCGAFHGQR